MSVAFLKFLSAKSEQKTFETFLYFYDVGSVTGQHFDTFSNFYEVDLKSFSGTQIVFEKLLLLVSSDQRLKLF